MPDWYSRKEVAGILGVSLGTVYNYAKQNKIVRIEDPHRLIRETRYRRREVDELAAERKRNQPTGLRPSELASKLNVPVRRIYTLIHENDLAVETFPVGDERTAYSIPEESAKWIEGEIEKNAPERGTRSEFYESSLDITLYQRFLTKSEQEIRVLRNEKQEWGFYLQSRSWIPYADGINVYQYKAAYDIHQHSMTLRGYTDFILPKSEQESFEFLDFVYQVWGIENIRLREHETHIALSIKSGKVTVSIESPASLTDSVLASFTTLGEVVRDDNEWHMISGYRRTTFDLPNHMLDAVQRSAESKEMTMSEYVEMALKKQMERE